MSLKGNWTVRSNDTKTGLLSFFGWGADKAFMKDLLPLGSTLRVTEATTGILGVNIVNKKAAGTWEVNPFDPLSQQKVTGKIVGGPNKLGYRFELCWRGKPADENNPTVVYGIISPILSVSGGNPAEELGDPGVWEADDAGDHSRH